MTDVDALYEEILNAIRNKALALPVLPDVAMRVTQAVRDEKRNIGDIAKIIQADVAITARLIQIANSPLYRGLNAVANCHTAVTRLGINVTRNLVTSFALRRVFRSDSPVLRERMDALWSHSTHVSAISFVLARVTLGLDPDRAMLAGLVHDIGVLPVLAYLQQLRQADFDANAIDELIHRYKGRLGAVVLETWKFDPELVQVAEEAEIWYRNPHSNPDYCDVVLIAQLHSLFGKTSSVRRPALDDVPAFHKFSVFTLGPTSSIELLREARQDIEDIRRMLQS